MLPMSMAEYVPECGLPETTVQGAHGELQESRALNQGSRVPDSKPGLVRMLPAKSCVVPTRKAATKATANSFFIRILLWDCEPDTIWCNSSANEGSFGTNKIKTIPSA